MDLLRLLSGYATAALPRAAWTHEAHLLAGLTAALAALRPRIIALNEAHGVPDTDHSGYHHTITWCFVEAIGAFLDRHEVDAATLTRRRLSELGEALLADPLAGVDAPLARFSAEQLADPTARCALIEPAGAPRGSVAERPTDCGDFVTAA